MAKAKLPISRAKTAYGLLSDICKLITEEPLRYAQNFYIDRAGEPYSAFAEYPACGTVGCVAGWVATLKTKRRFRYSETPSIAQAKLGIDDRQSLELFAAYVGGGAQTELHALGGVAHIRKFQQKYRHQLLAKKV